MRHPYERPICSILHAALLLTLLAPRFAGAGQFQGTPVAHGKEQCIALNRFSPESGAKYLPKDGGKEAELCRVAFDDKAIGLCPKTWSTSPGTIVYDISKSKYNGHPDAFEAEYCPKQRALKGKIDGIEKIASFKQSINAQFQQRTSATYSQASPLYYHFSRYLNATVDVPVAVIRTMDADEHLRRVANRGSALVHGGMIAAGWNVVISAEKNPSGYVPEDEFYYGDFRDGVLYGTMLKGPGARSGAEFNGNIAGKGYTEQYRYIQKTPAFLALSNPKEFAAASAEGLASSKTDPVVARALGAGVSSEQMMFWMTELSDILLLDYIFNQQDRPGNVDYTWVWYYLDSGGRLKSARVDSEASRLAANSVGTPTEVKNSSKSMLIERIQINDNDAGGRKYTNFTKRFSLLEKLHHLNAVTYRQLIKLGNDFRVKGPLYRYLLDTFDLHDAYVVEIAQNVIQAGLILKKTCNDGSLRFDLEPESYVITAQAHSQNVDCEAPM
jgi:hypothetical protein